MLDRDIIVALKKVGTGPTTRKQLRIRMQAEMEDPDSDPMTARLIPALELCRPDLVGKILDVGCYTGFLYHYLGKPKNYTGVDVWSDAIEVAKEFFPEADFRALDAFTLEGKWDVLWCSQIIWHGFEGGPVKAIESLKHLAKKCLFVLVDADIREPFPYKYERAGQLRIVRIGD